MCNKTSGNDDADSLIKAFVSALLTEDQQKSTEIVGKMVDYVYDNAKEPDCATCGCCSR